MFWYTKIVTPSYTKIEENEQRGNLYPGQNLQQRIKFFPTLSLSCFGWQEIPLGALTIPHEDP